MHRYAAPFTAVVVVVLLTVVPPGLDVAHALRVEAAPAATVAAAAPLGAPWHPGAWENLGATPEQVIHSALLPTGKVLLFGFGFKSWLWNPVTGAFEGPQAFETKLFCSGMAMLADGRVLAVGGTAGRNEAGQFLGLASAEVFDPVTESWSRVADLNAEPRWYPTAVTLADGRVAVFTGTHDGAITEAAEVYTPETDSWETLGAERMPIYMRGHVVVNGSIHFTGPGAKTYWWNPLDGAFAEGARRTAGGRWGGGSVLLDAQDGDVLTFSGAGTNAPATSEVFDPAVGAWQRTGDLAHPRVWPEAVRLPSGEVLAIGGETAAEGTAQFGVPIPTELFDRATSTWREGAAPHHTHPYHGTALLMPDGSVFATQQIGRGVERYLPWYFFDTQRPRLDFAPRDIVYGVPYVVATPDAERVQDVVLVRAGSVTHSLNTDDRLVTRLALKAPGVEAVAAYAPVRPAEAPPGHYMLFLVDVDGVPSRGAFVHVGPGLGEHARAVPRQS